MNSVGIVDWSQEHVFSTMYLCWGALAGLYYLRDIPKKMLGAKLFGIFQRLCDGIASSPWI